MKTLSKILIGASMLALSGAAWGETTTTTQTRTAVDGVTTSVTNENFVSSDAPAVGDPLGNHPVSAKDDAGPPLTQRLSYGPDCTDEACARAEKRQSSPTHWTQDRASGLSQGWGK